MTLSELATQIEIYEDQRKHWTSILENPNQTIIIDTDDYKMIIGPPNADVAAAMIKIMDTRIKDAKERMRDILYPTQHG